MKRLAIGLVMGVVFLLGLPGCASVSDPSAATEEVDVQRVASIERVATGLGVKVIWFKYPTKKVATTGG